MNQGVAGQDSRKVDLFSRLPPELKREICEYLCTHCTTEILTKSWFFDKRPYDASLASLCLTSRPFQAIAQPILYHYFRCRKDDRHSTMVSFARTINKRPDLADQIRRLEYVGKQAHSQSGQPLSRLSSDIAHQLPLSLQKILMLFNSVLTQATNVEMVAVATYKWTLPAINLPRLRFLQLYMDKFSVTRLPSGTSMGVREAPQIERLQLNCYRLVCPYLSNLAPNTQRLTLRMSNQAPVSIDRDIAKLVEGLPKLTTFELSAPETFRDYARDDFDFASERPDFLSGLLVRKDDLTRISLRSSDMPIKLSLLKNFTNLKHLRLDGGLLGSDDFEEYVCLLKLESLWIQLYVGKPMWLVAQMSERASRDGHLKYVRCDRFIDYPIPEIDYGVQSPSWQENVKKNFEAAGVEFEMSPPHTQWRSFLFD
ncbi:hypothetical protein B0J13DRAFT_623069 [Dactylonectria estremocensis]|uniref:F-box domain-containing protein n=1 Tax=Dactylonectria estremocensis TaxID=1079267 RepID=A0A9P9ETW9_9HYPO|nr:hypothetical protein B0J13DRAFT_623069 [Dactylonectria estremocensis]